jgi:hypothetical protein
VNALRSDVHPLSDLIARDAGKFLAVIDHVLALNYLKPELRQRVVKLQKQLIKAAVNARYQPPEE